jgi:hypothetical protein
LAAICTDAPMSRATTLASATAFSPQTPLTT